jgi:hypothetical protein
MLLLLVISVFSLGNALALRMGIDGLHKSLLTKVKDTLDLKPTDFPTKYDATTFSAQGFEGSCEWWDEVKGSKLTGVSSNIIINPTTGFSSYQLNCWMGPAYNAPHMLLNIMTDPTYSGFGVRADYLARGPVPLGSDQTAVDTYYGKDVISWYDNAVGLSGCMFLPPSTSFAGRLLRSPIELGIAGIDEASVSTIAFSHVDRWLTYVLEAKQNEARSRGAINTRDDKQRMFAFKAEVVDCTRWVGVELGQKLGAARTGPVAEAYVGGGG